MRFLCLTSGVFVVGLITLSQCVPEPPSNNNQGWGQQQQQPQMQQAQGWGQQPQQQQQQAQGWGQQQQQPEAQSSGGWGQPQQQQQEMQSGWGQPQQETQSGWSSGGQDSSSGGQKGKGGVNWGFNFALGHQGDNNKGGKGGGDKGSGGGGGGWSSMPETNIKKPSIGDIFRTIIGIPREIKNLLKESGLWILFLPLIVILPLIYVAYSAGRFFGGLHGHGWGWDKRSQGKINEEWNSLMGFLKDPKVHKAAKGFMDEFVVKRIINSVEDPVATINKKSS